MMDRRRALMMAKTEPPVPDIPIEVNLIDNATITTGKYFDQRSAQTLWYGKTVEEMPKSNGSSYGCTKLVKYNNLYDFVGYGLTASGNAVTYAFDEDGLCRGKIDSVTIATLKTETQTIEQNTGYKIHYLAFTVNSADANSCYFKRTA